MKPADPYSTPARRRRIIAGVAKSTLRTYCLQACDNVHRMRIETKCSIILQCSLRCYQSRKKLFWLIFKKRYKAAVAIQTLARRRLATKELICLLNERNRQRQKRLAELVEILWYARKVRMFEASRELTRKLTKERRLNRAATEMGRLMRGHIGRQRVRLLRQQRDRLNALKTRACVAIQCSFRQFLSRQRLKFLILQRNSRELILLFVWTWWNCLTRRRIEASTSIQRIVRGFLVRLRVLKLRQEKKRLAAVASETKPLPIPTRTLDIHVGIDAVLLDTMAREGPQYVLRWCLDSYVLHYSAAAGFMPGAIMQQVIRSVDRAIHAPMLTAGNVNIEPQQRCPEAVSAASNTESACDTDQSAHIVPTAFGDSFGSDSSAEHGKKSCATGSFTTASAAVVVDAQEQVLENPHTGENVIKLPRWDSGTASDDLPLSALPNEWGVVSNGWTVVQSPLATIWPQEQQEQVLQDKVNVVRQELQAPNKDLSIDFNDVATVSVQLIEGGSVRLTLMMEEDCMEEKDGDDCESDFNVSVISNFIPANQQMKKERQQQKKQQQRRQKCVLVVILNETDVSTRPSCGTANSSDDVTGSRDNNVSTTEKIKFRFKNALVYVNSDIAAEQQQKQHNVPQGVRDDIGNNEADSKRGDLSDMEGPFVPNFAPIEASSRPHTAVVKIVIEDSPIPSPEPSAQPSPEPSPEPTPPPTPPPPVDLDYMATCIQRAARSRWMVVVEKATRIQTMFRRRRLLLAWKGLVWKVLDVANNAALLLQRTVRTLLAIYRVQRLRQLRDLQLYRFGHDFTVDEAANWAAFGCAIATPAPPAIFSPAPADTISPQLWDRFSCSLLCNPVIRVDISPLLDISKQKDSRTKLDSHGLPSGRKSVKSNGKSAAGKNAPTTSATTTNTTTTTTSDDICRQALLSAASAAVDTMALLDLMQFPAPPPGCVLPLRSEVLCMPNLPVAQTRQTAPVAVPAASVARSVAAESPESSSRPEQIHPTTSSRAEWHTYKEICSASLRHQAVRPYHDSYVAQEVAEREALEVAAAVAVLRAEEERQQRLQVERALRRELGREQRERKNMGLEDSSSFYQQQQNEEKEEQVGDDEQRQKGKKEQQQQQEQSCDATGEHRENNSSKREVGANTATDTMAQPSSSSSSLPQKAPAPLFPAESFGAGNSLLLAFRQEFGYLDYSLHAAYRAQHLGDVFCTPSGISRQLEPQFASSQGPQHRQQQHQQYRHQQSEMRGKMGNTDDGAYLEVVSAAAAAAVRMKAVEEKARSAECARVVNSFSQCWPDELVALVAEGFIPATSTAVADGGTDQLPTDGHHCSCKQGNLRESNRHSVGQRIEEILRESRPPIFAALAGKFA